MYLAFSNQLTYSCLKSLTERKPSYLSFYAFLCRSSFHRVHYLVIICQIFNAGPAFSSPSCIYPSFSSVIIVKSISNKRSNGNFRTTYTKCLLSNTKHCPRIEENFYGVYCIHDIAYLLLNWVLQIK
jgi:hypothetical protein